MSARRIVSATLGAPLRVQPEGHGDVWTTTWAGDDHLYSVADDSNGFGGACESNLAIHRIIGTDPTALRGETVNCMRGYGDLAALGDDGACWKANGLACVDGVLYLSVSRHYYYNTSPFWIQNAWDSSIVKSEDYGETWSAAPRFGTATFPGASFGAPFFVHFGKDGHTDVPHAKSYIYAVSSDGVWNNGSSMALGRVPSERIGALDRGDWEFIQGFADGEPVWGARHDTARAVFRSPGRTSMTGVQYLSPLGIYVMPQWHYPHLDRPHPDRWQVTRWELYQAAEPWGPWTLFHEGVFAPQAFYNPSIPAKFVSEDGLSFWIFTAGDFATQAHYALHAVPVSLEVEE